MPNIPKEIEALSLIDLGILFIQDPSDPILKFIFVKKVKEFTDDHFISDSVYSEKLCANLPRGKKPDAQDFLPAVVSIVETLNYNQVKDAQADSMLLNSISPEYQETFCLTKDETYNLNLTISAIIYVIDLKRQNKKDSDYYENDGQILFGFHPDQLQRNYSEEGLHASISNVIFSLDEYLAHQDSKEIDFSLKLLGILKGEGDITTRKQEFNNALCEFKKSLLKIILSPDLDANSKLKGNARHLLRILDNEDPQNPTSIGNKLFLFDQESSAQGALERIHENDYPFLADKTFPAHMRLQAVKDVDFLKAFLKDEQKNESLIKLASSLLDILLKDDCETLKAKYKLCTQKIIYGKYSRKPFFSEDMTLMDQLLQIENEPINQVDEHKAIEKINSEKRVLPFAFLKKESISEFIKAEAYREIDYLRNFLEEPKRQGVNSLPIQLAKTLLEILKKGDDNLNIHEKLELCEFSILEKIDPMPENKNNIFLKKILTHDLFFRHRFAFYEEEEIAQEALAAFENKPELSDNIRTIIQSKTSASERLVEILILKCDDMIAKLQSEPKRWYFSPHSHIAKLNAWKNKLDQNKGNHISAPYILSEFKKELMEYEKTDNLAKVIVNFFKRLLYPSSVKVFFNETKQLTQPGKRKTSISGTEDPKVKRFKSDSVQPPQPDPSDIKSKKSSEKSPAPPNPDSRFYPNLHGVC